MKLTNPDIRRLNDMKEVLYDQEWAKTAPNLELYYMYRGVKQENGIRYDITVIPFQMLGQEFTKTKGHSHLNRYTEIYEVLEGQAIYLMQKCSAYENKDAYAVEAKKGDKIFIPPYYAHITINPGPNELKMANWLADDVQSDYSLIIEKQGACYYYIENRWIKNPKYDKVPELRFEEPNQNIPQNLKTALRGE